MRHVWKFAGMLGAMLACAACTTTVEVERAVFVNGVDPRPRIDKAAALSGAPLSLSPSDTVLLARGNVRQVTAPQPVTVRIVQEVNVRDDGSHESEVAVGGFDSDGVLNDGRPAAERPRFVFYKYVEGEQQSWGSSRTLRLNAVQGEIIPLRFRLMVVNLGGAEFRGNLDIVDRLPQDLRLDGTSSIRTMQDNRDAKMALSLIPYLGLLALAINDYSIGAPVAAATSMVGEREVRIALQNVSVPVRNGFVIEFGATTARPPSL